MNRILISLRDIPTTRLQLGFEGENDHTQVIFDGTLLYARYPSAVASMTVKSPSGGLYPKELVKSGNNLIWNVSASDCAKAGSGQFQLTFTSGTEVIKTYIGSFSVNASLLGSGDPPDPVEDWLQEAQEALDAFEQDVSDAEAWAVGTRDGDPVESTDSAYHNNSKYYAEQAGAIEQTIETTGTAQVAAIEAKGEEVLESIPSDYTALSEDVDELYAIKAPAIECSASGSIASFPDGADGMPLKNLSVAIEPVQDLHGQDSPYPAGGGKNLYNADAITSLSSSGITLTINNGTITMNGTATGNAFFTVQNTGYAQGNYVFSFNNPVANANVHCSFRAIDGSYFLDKSANAINTIVAITGEPDAIILYVSGGTTLTNFVVKPQLEAGSSASAWSPYSNVCPISGWTGAEVTRTGKNLLDDTGLRDSFTSVGLTFTKVEGAHYKVNGTSTSAAWIPLYGNINVVPIHLPVGDYTLSANSSKIRSYLYPGNNLDETNYVANPGSVTALNKAVCGFRFLVGANASFVNEDIYLQFELGSTATAYEPYQGNTYDITFPSSAGTVYGGTLTIHQDGSGELVKTHKMWVADGNTPWTIAGKGTADVSFYTQSGYDYDVKTNDDNGYSNYFKYRYSFNTSGTIMAYSNRININKGSGFTSVAELQAAFAQTPLQMLYPLATPVTYQLTNQQVIETLKGVNNLWSSTGSVSIEYPADTRLFIEKRISELQALILENISNS